MLPKFFIDRPIFAWVIALIILLSGVLALRQFACRVLSGGGSTGFVHHAQLSRRFGAGGGGKPLSPWSSRN